MSTSIAWTDVTWNPVVGCSRVSAGCDHCYAMGVAHRKMTEAHIGLTKLRPKDAARPGVDWNGTVRTLPLRLREPLRWRKPRRVFVNSMSDLFHDAVPFEFIAAVFGVMGACPQHTFQVLTKRPARMLEFFAWMVERTQGNCRPNLVAWSEARKHQYMPGDSEDVGWPMRNVHLGVSAEDQATADDRIPLLLQAPAAIRWVSYEPALGPIDFDAIQIPGVRPGLRFSALRRQHDDRYGSSERLLNWIVIGGESGSGARPFDVEWGRAVIEQVCDSGCALFFKQLGARPHRRDEHHGLEPIAGRKRKAWRFDDGDDVHTILDPAGGDMSEWPVDLRVREVIAA